MLENDAGTNSSSSHHNNQNSYAEYLNRAIQACTAGDVVLGLHLYLAAYERSLQDSSAHDPAVIEGLRQAWVLACQHKERSLAEYIFEKLEPYLSVEETAHHAAQLQRLALDKLEEFGLTHEDLEEMAEMISQDFMDFDPSALMMRFDRNSPKAHTFSRLRKTVATESETQDGHITPGIEGQDGAAAPVAGINAPAVNAAAASQDALATGAAANQDALATGAAASQDALAAGAAASQDALASLEGKEAGSTTPLTDPHAKAHRAALPAAARFDSSADAGTAKAAIPSASTSPSPIPAEAKGQTAASDVTAAPQAPLDLAASAGTTGGSASAGTTGHAAAADASGGTASAGTTGHAAAADASGGTDGASDKPAAPEQGTMSLGAPLPGTPRFNLAPFGDSMGLGSTMPFMPPLFAVPPQQAEKPAPAPEHTTYRDLVGYETAIEAMHGFGIGMRDDPRFKELVALLNKNHGLSEVPATDSFLFCSPVREDANQFMAATMGELGLPTIRMRMEENIQGLPVLCVMAQADNPFRLNAARTNFEGGGVLVIEDIDLWASPLSDAMSDEFGGFVFSQLSRGAREAINLIRSAVENPQVYVLASAAQEEDTDPFFFDLLEPFTVVDIALPNKAERVELWANIAREHPSLAALDQAELVAFSAKMSRFDIYMAAREAVEEAYKAGLAARRYIAVTRPQMLEKIAAYQPLESQEYQDLEDAVVVSFSEGLDNLEDLLKGAGE
ncbi:MAG: hypothetical protein LBG81_01985 [Coriobacteriaceae bacterium]|jgi:hypothetical protein|nr:hypothetical protein [Coriobacteriaceae bacterium]